MLTSPFSSVAQKKKKVSFAKTTQMESVPTETKAPTAQREEDFFRIQTLAIPDDIKLEVGGVATLPDGRLALCTRRGDIYIVSNPLEDNNKPPTYKLFASGLHEPLGIIYHNKSFYCAQRGEITRLVDTNGDDIADNYETVYTIPLSGNYHEYAFGPIIDKEGNLYITLNIGFFMPEWWIGKSIVPYRGWMLKIRPDGQVEPFATGLRSPAGLGFNNEGDIFYTENQGDWVGSGWLMHLTKGDFAANPAGLNWTSLPNSPLRLKPESIISDNRPMYQHAKTIKEMKLPAVWLPHGILGISTSGILANNQGDKFGPFENQVFIGDEGQSKIMRLSLEKIKGVWQGVAFNFREGFQSGVLRMSWANDGTMMVGQTNRGWASTGKDSYGLQRIIYTGVTPFEMKTVKAKPDGFEIEFTQTPNPETAKDIASYSITSFTYQYHQKYGSPVEDSRHCPIKAAILLPDGKTVRLVTDSARQYYIHEIKAEGVLNQKRQNLLHTDAYYTLNQIPDGAKAVYQASNQINTTPKEDIAHNKEMDKALVAAKVMVKEAPALPKRLTTMPKDWGKADVVLKIGTASGLKFDPTVATIKAGSKVKLIFTNYDDMIHNLVLVQPGTAIEVGKAAMKLGLKGAAMGYIPVVGTSANKIIANTKLMQPQDEDIIYFKAPSKPGDYIYVCTLPGHFYTMQGTLKVVK